MPEDISFWFSACTQTGPPLISAFTATWGGRLRLASHSGTLCICRSLGPIGSPLGVNFSHVKLEVERWWAAKCWKYNKIYYLTQVRRQLTTWLVDSLLEDLLTSWSTISSKISPIKLVVKLASSMVASGSNSELCCFLPPPSPHFLVVDHFLWNNNS